MNTILLVLLPILFIIGFQAGRDVEVRETLAMREKIVSGWLQDCTKPIVIRENGRK